jgi:hypothetical protein
MASRSLEDHISSLLSRRVAEEKAYGTPNQNLESIAVFESIALNFILRPRTVYYFTLLAKNGLLKTVNEELSTLGDLEAAIDDLANPSYKIEGETPLVRARTALLQLERLPKFGADPSSGAVPPSLSLYLKASAEFLNKSLAKNVRTVGAEELARPSGEAAIDLLSTFSSLKVLHKEFLDRLNKLDTGVENFLKAQFSTLVGQSTVSRVRRDLDGIISIVRDGGDPATARDLTNRMLGSRSVLKKLSAIPDINAPLVPEGSICTVGPSLVTAQGGVGPFTLPINPQIQITVEGTTYGPIAFFIGDAAILVSTQVSLPITFPAGTYLTVEVTTPSVTVLMGADMSGTYTSIDQISDRFNQNLTNFGSANSVQVDSTKLANCPDRWMLYSEGATTLKLVHSPTVSIQGVDTTVDTCEADLGFLDYRDGTASITAEEAAAVIAYPPPGYWPTVTADTYGGAVRVMSQDNFSIEAPTVLGLNGVYVSSSDFATFQSPIPDVGIGDTLTIGGESSTIVEVDYEAYSVKLSSAIKDQTGVATVVSSLSSAYSQLREDLDTFLTSWNMGLFHENLDALDRAIAPLATSRTAAQRNPAKAVISELRTYLEKLKTVLEDVSLPSGAAKLEAATALGIIHTLQERGYDRAADLLMKNDITSLIGMDESSASYGGNFLQKTSKFATSSMKLTRDETDDDVLTKSISTGRSADVL